MWWTVSNLPYNRIYFLISSLIDLKLSTSPTSRLSSTPMASLIINTSLRVRTSSSLKALAFTLRIVEWYYTRIAALTRCGRIVSWKLFRVLTMCLQPGWCFLLIPRSVGRFSPQRRRAYQVDDLPWWIPQRVLRQVCQGGPSSNWRQRRSRVLVHLEGASASRWY